MRHLLSIIGIWIFTATVSVAGIKDITNLNPAEPDAAATNILFPAINSTGFTISWTNGSGGYRLVVIRAGGAVNQLPTDGTIYTANSNLASAPTLGGGNYIMYNGSSSQVTITGLTPGTTYHVAIYEFNFNGANTNYLTALNLTGSATTAAPTGVSSGKMITGVKVFPNPVQDVATLQFPYVLSGDVQLIICDLLGNELKVLPIKETDKILLSRDGLKNGIYFFQLMHEGEMKASGKFIVN